MCTLDKRAELGCCQGGCGGNQRRKRQLGAIAGNVRLIGANRPKPQVEPMSHRVLSVAFGLCVAARPRRGPVVSSLSGSRPEHRCQAGRQAPATGQEPAKEPQKVDEYAEAAEGAWRPGRQSRMRLAGPPGGQPAVARRSRYRLPPSRSLRPFRLPERPYPGDLPLPDSARQQHRPQGRRQPQRPGPACWINPTRRPRRRRPPPPPPFQARPRTASARPARRVRPRAEMSRDITARCLEFAMPARYLFAPLAR